MGKRYMKRTILLICICMMTLGLWGCSSTPAEQNSTVENDDTTPNLNNESTVTTQELDSFGTTILVPLDVKNGYILPDGNVYFDEVSINSMDDAVALINEYNLKEEGSYTIFYVTPEYYGRIMYMEEDNLYCITKEAASYAEEYTYNEDGLVSSGRWEYGTDAETTKPDVLEHGDKIYDNTVYIDTNVTNIEGEKSIGVFLDLIGEHFGKYDPSITYHFVTDETEYIIRKESYGYDVCIRPAELGDTYTEEYFEYGEDKTQIGYVVQSYKDGKFSYILQTRGDFSGELEYLDNNVIVNTVTENGVTTTHKYQSIGDKAYSQYYRDNEKEVTLTYDASGTMLIRYTSVNFKDGCTYDWVLDGGGYDPSNCISVTITQGSSSKTYTGKDEIPWGSPIDYPPKVAGLYE